jgi:hypothetical protein
MWWKWIHKVNPRHFQWWYLDESRFQKEWWEEWDSIAPFHRFAIQGNDVCNSIDSKSWTGNHQIIVVECIHFQEGIDSDWENVWKLNWIFNDSSNENCWWKKFDNKNLAQEMFVCHKKLEITCMWIIENISSLWWKSNHRPSRHFAEMNLENEKINLLNVDRWLHIEIVARKANTFLFHNLVCDNQSFLWTPTNSVYGSSDGQIFVVHEDHHSMKPYWCQFPRLENPKLAKMSCVTAMHNIRWQIAPQAMPKTEFSSEWNVCICGK